MTVHVMLQSEFFRDRETGEEFSPGFFRYQCLPAPPSTGYDQPQQQPKKAGFYKDQIKKAEFYKDQVEPKEAEYYKVQNNQLLRVRRDSESSGTKSRFDYVHGKAYSAVTEQKAFHDVLPRQDDKEDFTGNGLTKTTTSKHSYHDGGCSDPTVPTLNSRAYDDEEMEVLCSFGGKILPQPCDGKLRYVYVGGQTRSVSIKKHLTFSDLQKKTSAICNQIHKIKYQLPGEDLDTLISVCSDEDVQYMIQEYCYDDDSKAGFRMFLVSAPTTSDGSATRKMKLLCRFGGKITPQPCDGKLIYVGGETRIVSFTGKLTFSNLEKKTSAICSQIHKIKYQLPGEDLDVLISVSSEEDVQHMIEEYNEEGSERVRIFLVAVEK